MERVDSASLKMTFLFNGQQFHVIDSDSSNQPQKIDTLAIHFSNARPYDYVVLKSVMLHPDLNGDGIVNFLDFSIFAEGL